MWKDIECIKNIIVNSKTKTEVLKKMNKTPNANNFRKLKDFISLNEINTSHFDNIGFKKNHKPVNKIDNSSLFVKNSENGNTTIRRRILKGNLISYKCHECKCSDKWRGKRMPLILDHINGINSDNRLENLRFLCSNCDSIQPTYKGRNNKNPKSNRQNYLVEIKLKQEFKIKKLELIKQKIKNSKIDFSKKTWGVEISKLLNKSPQYCLKFIKKNFPEFIK
jgi:hypothetical protein